MAERKDWKDYELQILKVFREKYPSRLVLDNQKITGRHSKRPRQIDVAVYNKVFNIKKPKIDIAIECRYLNRHVTLPALDALYGKLHDMGVAKGIIVTTKGFTTGTKNYANKKGIILKAITYEFLKDYYYIPPNDIPDIFMKATRYMLPFCEECNCHILFEIGEVYGLAEHEMLSCPKCKSKLQEVRTDANHRVIKIFREAPSKKDLEAIIAKHINITRDEWASEFAPVSSRYACYICKHDFCDNPPTRTKTKYKGRNVCSDCIMSSRTLLLDYHYI